MRAIFEAACEVKKQGIDVRPEVMIPLVGTVKELQLTTDMRAGLYLSVIPSRSEESGGRLPARHRPDSSRSAAFGMTNHSNAIERVLDVRDQVLDILDTN